MELWRWSAAMWLYIIFVHFRLSSSCSCLPSHPQTQFCNSDFVLMVKVKEGKLNVTEQMVGYHVVIKKVFKMTDKASLALKSKVVWSAQDDATCGVKLQDNMKYLITGRTHNNKASISLCSYHQQWNLLTPKQRKGFRLLYKQGCECKVQVSYCRDGTRWCPRNQNTCLWETWRDPQGGCQSQHAICMQQAHGKCDWNKSKTYRSCLKERREKKQRQRELEP